MFRRLTFPVTDESGRGCLHQQARSCFRILKSNLLNCRHDHSNNITGFRHCLAHCPIGVSAKFVRLIGSGERESFMASKTTTSRKGRIVKPRPLYVPIVPDGASWLESDSYDRRAWSDIGLGAPTVKELIEAGERLVPHFGALLEDIFLGLFKYNLIWLKPDAVRRSAMLNRTVLEQLIPSPGFEILKARTLLEEDKAVIAGLVLGEQVLEMVRNEKLVNRREMLDLWDVKHQEEDLEERAAALKNAAEMSEEQKQDPNADADLQKKIDELKEAAERAAKVSEARLNQKARLLEDQLRHGDHTELKPMQGDKELWAKAVSLTLMDIARRQRRLFRAVLFSSGPESLRVLDLNNKRRYQPELTKVLEMAEYFPGGVTDFQTPIDAAIELLEDRKLERGDIVVITDGECQVAPEWLAGLRERKEELKFSIFAVLVDVGSSELSTLAQFSDRVSSVKKLTVEGSREIFLKI